MEIPSLLIAVIVLALIFDYINGFHDSANAIATIVSTKVLTPFQAVLWAAFFNFAAFFISKYLIGEFKVGDTISKAVDEQFVTLEVILAALIAAITWNLITWWYGIPSSSSHTLLGGFIGAALAHAGGFTAEGAHVVNYIKVLPIIAFIFLAPLIGMFMAFVFTVLIVNLFKKSNPAKADKWFKKLQLLSSALFSLGHGGNDAQKVMGIIGAAVIYYHVNAGHQEWIDSTDRFNLFVDEWAWVPFLSFVVIALGTLSGGWKIVKTMGTKITKVTSLEGVAAESAGAATLYISEYFGIPVSTTHTITGAIIGVGMTKRISAVRWGITINLLWAWILTIPVSATIAAVFYKIVMLF
ncbi:MAG TPA: inorganic phosphate transporter [Chitinophagales bacterium]|nr:inorganic phosphate transporter [Chitinophagales bacterium]